MPQTELIGGTNMVAQQKPVRGLIQKKSSTKETSEGIVRKNDTEGKVRKEKYEKKEEDTVEKDWNVEKYVHIVRIYRGLESSSEN